MPDDEEVHIKLGKFTQCPECRHTSVYPFNDGPMCIKCGWSDGDQLPAESGD